MSGMADIVPAGSAAAAVPCDRDGGGGLSSYVSRTLEQCVPAASGRDVADAYAALERELAPNSGVERLLLAQMVVIHHRAMRGIRRDMLAEDEDVQHRRIEKLMRLYLQQMEALRKHRGGGQQTININHMYADKAVIGGPSREHAAR